MELRTRNYYTYEALEWHSSAAPQASGTNQDGVASPASSSDRASVSAAGQETYSASFTAGDKSYKATLPEQEWRALAPGASCHLTLGLLGGVKKVAPADRRDNRPDRMPVNEGTLVTHPLDPLTADEISRAAAIVRRDRGVGDGWRFASIELQGARQGGPAGARGSGRPGPAGGARRLLEPGRRAGVPGRRVAHRGRGHRLAAPARAAAEHDRRRVARVRRDAARPSGRAPRLSRRRGITDLSRVLADMWAYGAALVPERYAGRRIGWCDMWYRGSERGNPYAQHLTGLHPVVDLNTMDAARARGQRPRRATTDHAVMGEYLPDLLPMRLREVAPLQVSQPDGVGFTLDGNLLSWQNWQLRLGFNHREGLVLHQVAFQDGGRLRSVAHRLSFAEMVVPYRDASPDHYRRTAFDIGEWGLGFMTTSLTLGCDCLGEITYLDAVVHDSTGEPVTIPNAICVHEEDSGVLWKHVDERAGAEVRRARRLVVSFHVTVANYEYLVYWRFYQDGGIECEVRATGIMVTSHTAAPGSRPANGTVVDHGIYAPFHQHFIVARLDLDVDGPGNTVYVTESRPAPPGPDDPLRARPDDRPAPRCAPRRRAGRTTTGPRQRGWKVVNDNVRNGLGTPVGYKLVPVGVVPAAARPRLRRVQAGQGRSATPCG